MMMLTTIFEYQRQLNNIIGRDTVYAPKDEKMRWLFQYLYAAKVESGELLDCFDFEIYRIIDTKNACVEIIDVVHFVISACQIFDITANDVCHAFEDDSKLTNLFKSVIELDRMCEKVVTENIDWKWWSKTVKEDPSRQFISVFYEENMRMNLISLFEKVISVAHHLGLSNDEIFNIYDQKWRINIKRQEKDYDVRNKTEEDNQSITVGVDCADKPDSSVICDITTKTFVVENEESQLSLMVSKDTIVVRQDINKSFINITGNNGSLDDWMDYNEYYEKNDQQRLSETNDYLNIPETELAHVIDKELNTLDGMVKGGTPSNNVSLGYTDTPIIDNDNTISTTDLPNSNGVVNLNLPESNPIETAFNILTEAVASNESYAWSVYYKLVIPVMDERVDPQIVNKVAIRMMRNLFGYNFEPLIEKRKQI